MANFAKDSLYIFNSCNQLYGHHLIIDGLQRKMLRFFEQATLFYAAV